MSEQKPDRNRRQFVQLSGIGLAVAPLAYLLLQGTARAQELPKVEESDPMAQGLKYISDATQTADAKPGQMCKTCQLYSGEENAEWGPCAIFPGKAVNANGWCSAWVKKAG